MPSIELRVERFHEPPTHVWWSRVIAIANRGVIMKIALLQQQGQSSPSGIQNLARITLNYMVDESSLV